MLEINPSESHLLLRFDTDVQTTEVYSQLTLSVFCFYIWSVTSFRKYAYDQISISFIFKFGKFRSFIWLKIHRSINSFAVMITSSKSYIKLNLNDIKMTLGEIILPQSYALFIMVQKSL